MSSKEAEVHFDRGIHFFRGGFFPAALQEFRVAKQLQHDFPNIDYILEAAQKKTEEVAGKVFSFIEEAFDPEIVALSEELVIEGSSRLAHTVEQLLRAGREEEALQKLQQADSVVPESQPLLLLMSNIFRRMGRLADAEKTLLRARVLFPDDHAVLNNLGNVYLDRSCFADAEAAFTEARELAPDDIRILNNLGTLKMQRFQLDDAEELFDDARQRFPRNKVIARNLSNVRLRIKELDQEISRLRREYHEHPLYVDIGLSLGKALLFRGYSHEARSILVDVLEKKPDMLSAYYYLATIFELKGSLRKAITYFQEMVKRKGKDTVPEYLAHETFLKENYTEEALSELKKIAIIDLDLASSRINLGIKYFEEASWENALRHFKMASEIKTTYPDAFYWMALCYIQLGKKTEAKTCLNQAIELHPGYADAHYQLGMLKKKRAPRQAVDHLKVALDRGLRPAFAAIAREVVKLAEKNSPKKRIKR